MPRYYLAGPITDDAEYRVKFAAAAADLRDQGFDIENPVEMDAPEDAAEALADPYGPKYEELLARDLAIIEHEDVDGVVVLPGWEESRGARREVVHALVLHKTVLEYPRLTPVTALDVPDGPRVRTFDTGATRDTEDGKLDFEGYLSPLALTRYGEYMLAHSEQLDGTRRASDNWQKGIPLDAYMKSAWRHFVEWWTCHRVGATDEEMEEALCALLFNVSGYLHEHLKAKAD